MSIVKQPMHDAGRTASALQHRLTANAAVCASSSSNRSLRASLKLHSAAQVLLCNRRKCMGTPMMPSQEPDFKRGGRRWKDHAFLPVRHLGSQASEMRGSLPVNDPWAHGDRAVLLAGIAAAGGSSRGTVVCEMYS